MWMQLIEPEPFNQKLEFWEAFKSIGKNCKEIAEDLEVNYSTLNRYIRADVPFREDVFKKLMEYLKRKGVTQSTLARLKQFTKVRVKCK